MSQETKIREQLCLLAKSMFDRGLTGGSSGNISVRLDDGGLLATPTGTSLGTLDPASLSRFSADGMLVSGNKPTKEMPLHRAFYATRSTTGAVVHLHSTHSVALSMLPETDPDDVLPPLTPYSIMRLGAVKLLPYIAPGDPRMGTAIEELGGTRAAVLLANHGPVVSGKDLESAVYAIEELEETAKLAILLNGRQPRTLTHEQVKDLHRRFPPSGT